MCLRVVCICTVTAGCMVSWLVGRPLFGADESPVAAKTAGSTPGENQPSHDSAPGKIDFARQIRPILSDNCFYCHGPDENHREADLRLDSRDGMFADRDGSPAIVPGHPAKSALYERISSDYESMKMPPEDSGKKLTLEEIALIKRWIEEGADWSQHWAFVAPVRPEVPRLRESDENSAKYRIHNPIDAFVVARLKRAGLGMSPEAEKHTLLRRVSFDLTGLPPTPAEIDAFLADDSPDAYEKAVDRLLASPRYGEHQARYWLDLARYGDTHGLHVDSGRAIWPYRDWVIKAFNANMPYDQFIIEQLGGDLLPNATNDQRIATGFNRCNVTTSEGGAIDEEYYVRYNVDRVETMSTVFLGLTFGCAVCHDHKYDPISQRDFYQLFAFFNSTPEKAMDQNVMDPPPVIRMRPPEQQEELDALAAKLAALAAQKAGRAEEPEVQRAFADWLDDVDAAAQVSAKFDAGRGLVGHWAFDESEGNAVVSKQGDLPAGQLNRDPKRVDGKVKKALRIEKGAFADLGNVLDIDRGVAFSFGAWLFPDKNARGAVISKFNDRKGVMRGFDLYLDRGRPIVHLASHWPDNAIKVRTKSKLTPDQWQHVFVTYDGSSKAAGVNVYIDGKPAELEVESDTLSDTIRGGAALRIGRRLRSSILSGATIDEVRFYDRTLEATEVAALTGTNLVAELLALPADERTPEQLDVLRKYFLETFDKPWQQLAGAQAGLERRRNEIEQIPLVVSLVMEELPQPKPAYILERGQYDKKGEEVTRKVPAVLPPLPEGAPLNRLGLAQWLIAPEHPLTARVAVNHLWQNVFGGGIVASSEDFGSQGTPPTHPKLLDWLAVEFRESGWDVKRMMKLIVTSATYRQSSRLTPEVVQRDPENKLLARGPRLRLGAETIRDHALYVSGLLVETLGGPSVKPYQPPGIWEAVSYPNAGNAFRYEQDEGAAIYRRGLYVFWKRTAPPPSMTLFDAPSRESCTPRRSRTNSPTQALALMNDVQYVEAARHFAARMLKEGGSTPHDRIAFAFRWATSREPNADEVAVLVRQYEKHLADFRVEEDRAAKLLSVGDSPRDTALDPVEHAAWTMVANLILNLDETISKN